MGGFSNPVSNAAGTLVRQLMKSVNFVTGLAGWRITRDGDAEFNQGTFRGNLTIGTAPNQILIGQTIPALVSNYYAAGGPNGQIGTVRGVLVFQQNSQTFVYMALVTPNAGRPFLAFGGVESVGLVLSESYRVTPGTIGANAFLSNWGPLRIEAPGLLDIFGGLTLEPGSAWVVDGHSMGRGLMDFQGFNTNAGPLGPAETVIAISNPVTFKNGRAFAITFDTEFTMSSAAGVIVCLIRRNNVAGTRYGQLSQQSSNSIGSTAHAFIRTVIKNTSGSDINDNLVLTCLTGGGTATFQGSAITDRYFMIEDIGAAGNYPFAIAM